MQAKATKPMIKLPKAPQKPGCYLFRDKDGNVIYVGKAKNIKKRLGPYFSKKKTGDKSSRIAKISKSVDFFVTDNETEALILESNLIKKHQPKYNILLKDSKRYAYLEITSEEYPRIILSRKRNKKNASFGPFVSANARDKIADSLRKIFRIRTCKKLPKKECIRFSIGLCSAPCIKKISKKAYLKDIERAKMVLGGGTKELLEKLEKEMKGKSSKKEYETAMKLRDQISAIRYLNEEQKMERQKNYDEDVINFLSLKNKVYLILFNSRKGILDSKQDFELEKRSDFLEKFLIEYYSENKIPKEIILPKKISPLVKNYLEKKRGKKLSVSVPSSGWKRELLWLAKKNIEIMLFGDDEKLSELQKKLNLNEIPSVIECFDISHLAGTSTVASMVRFKNARPDKSNYRRYKIRSVDEIDDFASIKEVISRRYTYLKNGHLEMPKLILIDGGKGQLSSALEALNRLGLSIPVISLAKKHEEIHVPNRKNPLVLERKSKALKLLQEIRDEAHRFAINYNRLLRRKAVLK